MEAESDALGASGMLRQSPRDEESLNVSLLEKTADDIDVEATSDTESGEGVEKSSDVNDVKPTEDVDDHLGREDKKPVGLDERISNQNTTEMQSSGSTPKTVSDVFPDKKETQKEVLVDDKHADLSSDQKGSETKDSNSAIKLPSKTASEKFVMDSQTARSSCIVVEESLENNSKKERENQSVSTTRDILGTNSADMQKSSKIESGAKSLDSGLDTIKTSSVTSGNTKMSIAPTSKPSEEKFSRRLKSFEDAFKATLKNLEPSKETVGTEVIDLTENKESTVVLSDKNLDDSRQKKQKDIEQEPSSDQASKFDSKAIPEKEEGDVIVIDLTDNEEDSSKQPELENFSSDSSSTIIDVEQAAKESTEEEVSAKATHKIKTSESNETASQPGKAELKVDADDGEAKPGCTDPTSDTETSNKDGTSWFPKDEKKQNEMEISEDKALQADNRGKEKKKRHQSEQINKDIEPRRRSRKSIFLENKSTENVEGFRVFEGITFSQTSKTKDVNRRRYFTEQVDEQSRVERGSRIRSVPRERSKSDEGRILTGKKYRISKYGVVLQPGTKVEAMDYSKKWYTAKIINIDEGDSTVLIHFEGWNSRFDEWLEFDSDRLRPLARVSARKEVAKEVKALGGYKIGNEVLARWSDCRYYPAKILGIKTNGSYRVLFYDGIEKVVMGINVRDMPDSLKSQDFFSNLEHQFRSLLNKKRKSHKEEPDGKSRRDRVTKGSLSGSRPSSPVQPGQKRRHPSTSSTSSTSQPIKRSRLEPGKGQQPIATKVPKVTKPSDTIIHPPAAPPEPLELPSPTSSETSELIMSALEQGMTGKKRYREPLIFDKNSGLIRDPRRLIAPKELVIDLDHNKYKCEVPDCGKGFRKASLLEYHKKYYHINKPATSTSAHTAAKNAVTRSRKRLSTSTIAPGSSKIRRHESLDLTPAKVSNRQRSSAPGIMTSVYKRPLSSTQDTTKRLSQSIKSSRIKQKLMAVAKKQPPTIPSEESTSNLMKLPPSPGPILLSPKRSEVIPKVSERSRRVSGTTKDDKAIVSKDIVKEDIPISPSVPAPPPENQIKLEPAEPKPSDPETLPEVKSEVKEEPEVKDEVKDQIPEECVSEVLKDAVAASGSKKDKRNKTHKKHKRHKARSRDRRSREQSRSNRRRIAERAKERRLQQQSKAALELPEQSVDSVMEWTSKYLPSKGEKNLPHFPAQSDDGPDASKMMSSGGVGSSTAEEGGPKEMINCICRNQEEEGFMIQCETCFGWQHGGCVGLTEHTIPKQYICNFCTHPENLRTHARHRYNTEWFQTGKLPCLIKPKEPNEEAGNLTESMLQTHQLMADMMNVSEALDSLQRKIKILKSDNHPDLKLWSYHWGLKDETSNLDESSQSQTLHSSLDDTDLQLTSADNSALSESLRSDVLMDSMTQNDTSLGGLSNTATSDKPKPADDVGPQEGDRPRDVRNIFKSLRSMLSSGRYSQTPGGAVAVPERVNVEEMSDENKPSGSSGLVKSFGAVVHKVKPLHHTPVKSTPALSKPTGMPTACFVPDAAKDIYVTGEGGEPEKTEHDGNIAPKNAGKDDKQLSDDEPLINYVSKLMPSSVTVTGSSVWTPVKSPVKTPQQPAIQVDVKSCDQPESSKPVTLPSSDRTVSSQSITPPSSDQPVSGGHDTPLALDQTVAGRSGALASNEQTVVGRSITPPSSDQSVSVRACKMHLLNHIVCVEEELKRRMDVVEEQIEAMEVSFAQTTGTKDSKYIPTDPVQMTKTIRVIMNDLDQVSKLVSI